MNTLEQRCLGARGSAITVHQIWLQGSHAVPSELRAAMHTWSEAVAGHPRYRYRLWDQGAVDALLPALGLPRLEALYRELPTRFYGMRADIARLAILYRHGGLYVDADTRVLHPQPLLDYFDAALSTHGTDAVVGCADLPGWTRGWVEATRRPSNFLIACRPRSPFVSAYLRAIVEDRGRLREPLRARGRWSTYTQRRLTKAWTGPKQLRRVIRAARRSAGIAVRLTPVGFVASAAQDCFPHAMLAHEYQSRWYSASPAWRAARDAALRAFLRTPLDACMAGAGLAALGAAVLL